MKCLRCGEHVAEGQTFCNSCTETVRKPLPNSPFLNTQIVLPVRKPQPVVKKVEPKKQRKRRPWVLICLTVFLSLLCVASVLQGAFYAYGRAKLQDELHVAQSALTQAQRDADYLKGKVVFVQGDGSMHYHLYDCIALEKTNCWTYTPQFARNLGYRPCPLCHGE